MMNLRLFLPVLSAAFPQGVAVNGFAPSFFEKPTGTALFGNHPTNNDSTLQCPQFSLWLEHELFEDPDSADWSYCSVNFSTGMANTIEFVTFDYLQYEVNSMKSSGDNLHGLYHVATDVYIQEITRDSVQRTIQDLLSKGSLDAQLKPDCKAYRKSDDDDDDDDDDRTHYDISSEALESQPFSDTSKVLKGLTNNLRNESSSIDDSSGVNWGGIADNEMKDLLMQKSEQYENWKNERAKNPAQFTLGLEFDDKAVDKDNCRATCKVELVNGGHYIIEIWTKQFLESQVEENKENGKNLDGLYVIAPDLLVKELTEDCMHKVIANMLFEGDLQELLHEEVGPFFGRDGEQDLNLLSPYHKDIKSTSESPPL